MALLTSWISVLTALLLHIWRAKVYASGNTEEEIDYTYVIIGVILGAFLAIGFLAVIFYMIKTQMLDSVFGESDGKMDRRAGWKDVPITAVTHKENTAYVNTELKIKARASLAVTVSRLISSPQRCNYVSNMGSSQNREDTNVLENQSSVNQ